MAKSIGPFLLLGQASGWIVSCGLVLILADGCLILLPFWTSRVVVGDAFSLLVTLQFLVYTGRLTPVIQTLGFTQTLGLPGILTP